jgi:NADH dehydrogenase [ubiquinone] 1 alpha subcomplex assembly factor 1
MISIMLYDFSQNSLKSDWQIVDDVVMGGRSEGKFSINEAGNGIFQGKVSLENNGGFSSLRHSLNAKVGNNTKVRITLKGDGKGYQFRIKSSPYDRHSYISEFQTTGDWQEVVIPLSDMYPAFRGRKLEIPNFNSDQIHELAFLIGNKEAENFRLEISKIELI